MNRLETLLICVLAASALHAQTSEDKRAFVRLGALISDGDLKDYMGGKALGQTYELGYDIDSPDVPIGLDVYATYIVANGKNIAAYQGLKQVLYGWRLGFDSHFNTPVRGLRPYLGLNMTSWDGRRTSAGVVPNLDTPTSPYVLKTGPYNEGKAKFGFRAGLEYAITQEWGVTLDYNLSEWRWDNTGSTGLTGARTAAGINPVRPAWIGFAVQYRWAAFRK